LKSMIIDALVIYEGITKLIRPSSSISIAMALGLRSPFQAKSIPANLKLNSLSRSE
jgi:hypothetical protein